jgi:glycosyltransferase involved in cell wall biosynthesis
MNISFSIIIPVFRETGIINDLLSNIFKQFGQNIFEIIVVDGENNGNTINMISLGSDNIKKIVSKKNRAKQMNAGASVSNGNVLIFLHADCILPEDALNHIGNIFESDQEGRLI